MAKTPEQLKQEKALVAEVAASWVKPGMRLGIGSGSTVGLFIAALGKRSACENFEVRCVVASSASSKLAADAGFKVGGFDLGLPLDLCIDGADEIDPDLNMIKGGGGALLRERIVAAAGSNILIICDSSKPVQQLGRFPLAVEIVPFGADLARRDLAALTANPAIRMVPGGTAPFVTDEGNWIFDCPFGAIPDSARLADSLASVAALAAHGLFLGVADICLFADGKDLFLLKPGGVRIPIEQGICSPFSQTFEECLKIDKAGRV